MLLSPALLSIIINDTGESLLFRISNARSGRERKEENRRAEQGRTGEGRRGSSLESTPLLKEAYSASWCHFLLHSGFLRGSALGSVSHLGVLTMVPTRHNTSHTSHFIGHFSSAVRGSQFSSCRSAVQTLCPVQTSQVTVTFMRTDTPSTP